MRALAQVSKPVSTPGVARISSSEPARVSMSVPVPVPGLVPKPLLKQAVTRRPRVLVVAGPSPTVRERPRPARRVRGWECGDVASQAGDRSTAAPRRLEPAAAEQRRARRRSARTRVRRRTPSAVRSRRRRQLVPVRVVRRGDRSRIAQESRTAAAGRCCPVVVAAAAAPRARPGCRGRSASRSAAARLRAPVDSADNVAWFVADGVAAAGMAGAMPVPQAAGRGLSTPTRGSRFVSGSPPSAVPRTAITEASCDADVRRRQRLARPQGERLPNSAECSGWHATSPHSRANRVS